MDFPHFNRDWVPAGFLRRRDFDRLVPDGQRFLFGSSTSAFQIEGGLTRDGRRPSIFDKFAQDRDLFAPYGEDAVNHREFYKEDVRLMKQIGFNAYRFSLSWSRILPTGKKESRSQEGIDFYKDLLKSLHEHGIEPLATLVHFDPPQDLEKLYRTFLSPDIIDDFCDYAKICFEEFGEYVKYWTTINEPWYVCYGGYITGEIPPAYNTRSQTEILPNDHHPSSICPHLRRSMKNILEKKFKPTQIPECSHTVILPPREEWPYVAAYYQLLAHAHAYKLYKEEFQEAQGGYVGLNMVAQYYEPLEDTEENRNAAERARDFMLGWFMEPLFSGEYPESMKENCTPGRLREFSDDDKALLRGSYDFISLNYYTSMYVTNEETAGGDYVSDRRARFYDKKDGVSISPVQGAAGWVHGYPKGLLESLLHIKDKYGNPELIITENGIDDNDDGSMTHWNSFNDQQRVLYLHDHLSYVKEALRRGSNIKGHCVWSFLDNLELAEGYKGRFGITYVDYDDDESPRFPKYSCSWYKSFLAS